MKGYLIDPLNKRVKPFNFNGDHDTICHLIGAEFYDTQAINDAGDAVYVGEFSQSDENASQFSIEGVPGRFCGKAVILGVDEDGATCSPSLSLEDFRAKVTSYPNMQALLRQSAEMSGP